MVLFSVCSRGLLGNKILLSDFMIYRLVCLAIESSKSITGLFAVLQRD